MEKFISERAKEKVSKTDILQIANEARLDKEKGNVVLDASIGALLNDDKSLNGVSFVKKDLSKHITDNLAYPPTKGPEEYRDAILSWLLKDEMKRISSSYHIAFCATLGGTGACFISMGTFLDENQKVILPSPMWGNYKQIATKCGVGHVEYELTNSKGGLNLDSIKQRIEELKKTQNRILLIINDPCQNPTGFCINDEDYASLFSLLEEEGKTTSLAVLFDIAYLDYLTKGRTVHQMFMRSSEKVNSFLPCFAFSCSKTFGIYGLRCGALFCFAPDEENKNDIESSMSSFARGTYSCPDGPALHSVALTLGDEKNKNGLSDEIDANATLLYKRGVLLLSLLDKNHIKHYPFQSGFFVTIYSDDAFILASKLKKLHTYIVPLDQHYSRIALSGLDDDEIRLLVNQIKENM